MPRLGNNGGLMGLRRVPSTGSASGVWDCDEQSVAKRAGIWPITFSGPLVYNPLAWYDATSSLNVISGSVSSWDDKSGNGYHLLQSNSSIRPVYQENAVNGLNAVSFVDSAGQYLSATTSTITLPQEVYIVARYTRPDTFSPHYAGLFSANTDSQNTGPWVTGIGAGFYNQRYDGGYFLNGSTSDSQANVFPQINSPCLIRAVSNLSATYEAGYQVGCDRSYYDAQTFGYRYWTGYVCEILAFAQPLDSTARGVIQSYLATKWNLTLA